MLKENQDTNSIDTITSDHLLERVQVSVTDISLPQQKSSVLFEQLKSEFFNELSGEQSLADSAAQKIEQWLTQHSLEELTALNDAVKAHFLYQGITFTVYGDQEGTERTIPFDIIPRVMARQQWNTVALGCA